MQAVTLFYVFYFDSILWICGNMKTHTHTFLTGSQTVISVHSLHNETQI